tara:strand:- start:4544 stop:5467 length:924 start_codon:yes stop_codon:yes gene_type:complete
MADFNFDQVERGFGAQRQGRGGSFFINIAGAVTSVALIFGLGYWGYRLAVRDMTGIPVVRALEGPMRIAPQDPGGEITAHQGLSVNSVAADGAASRPADRVILAPVPVDLIAGDAAGTAVAVPGPVSARDIGSPGIAVAGLQASAPYAVDANDPAVMSALSEAISGGVTPLSGDIDPTAEIAPAYDFPEGTVERSPRPLPRPGAFRLAMAPAASVPEIDGTTLAAGTRLVQLGAFDSADTARKEWERLAGKFGDLLAGKTRIVQAAQSSGRTFYRLRADGFADEAESRRFCSALVAEKAACIPVTVR